MTRHSKRLEKIRNNLKDVRPQDLEALLFSLGFTKRSGKGDHRVYTKPGDWPVTLDFGRSPALEVYVKKILELFDGED